MTTYFNPDDMAFYSSELYSKIPSKAVPLSDEQYIALLNGQSEGKQIIADKTGYPVLIDPQPSAAHVLNLDTLTWEISAEKQVELFIDEKNRLLATLANKADALKSGLLIGYPQTEIESFYRQEKEALAWKADNKAETPMLKQIAIVRGVPFEVLVEKVIEKASQFAVAIGVIIGQRQAFEDRLLALSSQKELDALKKEIEEWTFSAN